MAFDLTSEPWLPCRAHDGTRLELGIGALFDRAQDLDSIDDPSPLVTLALHRLLLAILHRVLGPPSLNSWKSLYEAGRFPADKLHAYLEEHRDRFDLLDPSRPFYQTRGLPAEYQPDDVGRLILERSNYGAPSVLFQHRPTDLAEHEAIPFAMAARHLVALHAFVPGGLVRKEGEPGSASAGPLNRGAYILIRGRSLFETLLLNLVVYDPENGRPVAGDPSRDLPAWEQPPLIRPVGSREPKRTPYGYIDWLTWQSRRVELALSGDGSAVTGIVHCVAQGVDEPAPQDPMLAFRVDKQRGPVPIDLSESRALWRDCHAFIREAGTDGAAPPANVTQLKRRELTSVRRDVRPSLIVLGMRGDQAAIKIARAERLLIPAHVLADADLQSRLGSASEALEATAFALRGALRIAAAKALSPGGRDPHKDDTSNLVEAMGKDRAYWASLAIPFGRFLEELPREPEQATARLIAAARAVASDVLHRACTNLGGEARHLKGLAFAESYFRRELSNLQPGDAP